MMDAVWMLYLRNGWSRICNQNASTNPEWSLMMMIMMMMMMNGFTNL